MKFLTLEQAADYLESATIEETRYSGHIVINTGISAAGVRFALMNDANGHTVLSEAL